jgi:N-acetylglutamate synthase-like GNAT family acetyltransferase
MDDFGTAPGVHFRRARLRDIPYIFELITDVSLNDG